MICLIVWYTMAVWYSAGLAIARSRVRIPPVAAVSQRQLSVLSVRGRLMNSSLRGKNLVWLIGAVVYLSCCTTGPIVRYHSQRLAAYRAVVPLADYQSAVTSKIVKRCCAQVSSAIASTQTFTFSMLR